MVKGNRPGTSGYRITPKNTQADHDGNNTQYGAASGLSEGPDSGKQHIPVTLTVKGIQRVDEERQTMDLMKTPSPEDSWQTDSQCHYGLHNKHEKVLPSRQYVPLSGPEPSASSATPTYPDLTVDGDVDSTTRVFSYGADGGEDAPPDNDYTTPSTESETDVRLSGGVNRENVIISEETRPSREQVWSDQVVSDKRHTSRCVPNLLLSSQKTNGTSPLVILEDRNKEQHQERLSITNSECRNCENGFHPTKNHDFRSHRARSSNVMNQCQQMVGLVRCHICGDRGTCFRIGRCNIVTCHHVINKCTDHDVTAVFYKQGPNQQNPLVYKILKIREKGDDKELDFAIRELCDNGMGFPPAFTNFRVSTDSTDGRHEYLVYIVAFQKDSATGESKLGVHCDTVRLQNDTFDDEQIFNSNLQMMKKFPHIKGALPYGSGKWHRENGGIPLLSEVTHGGSGGVGVFFDESGVLVVDFMYRRGYPGFFYETHTKTSLSKEEKLQFPGCWRLEMGLDIKMIIEKS